MNGDEYYENKNMSYTDFYDFLKDKNTSVSTCQPSVEFVKEEWREVLKSFGFKKPDRLGVIIVLSRKIYLL